MNTKRIYHRLGMAVMAAIVTAGPVVAEEQGRNAPVEVPGFIQRFDQDDDGLVSMAEFPSAAQRFDRLDANGDGYIDASEAPSPHRVGRRRAGKMFARFDEDKDGRLSQEEFHGPDERFAQLDADGDGFLSKAELAQGMGRSGPARDDADNDGRVSLEEFSGPSEVFDRLDTNGDGYLDRDERRRGRPGKRPLDAVEEEPQ